MAGVILSRPEQLPRPVAALLGVDFRPEQPGDVRFIASLLAPQSLAEVAFNLSLVLSVPAVMFVLWMLIQAITQAQAGEAFRSEGVGIAALISVVPVALSLLSGHYWRRAGQLQQRIATGEFRLGLWMTATHLMQRDLNGGLECVALQEIARLDVYHSGRPPLAMVVVHLHNGQTLRIVANWLRGYPNQVDALRQLLADHLSLSRLRLGAAWTLTSADLFDRECEPTLEAKGSDLLEGLTLLWHKHLREGLQDDGQRTFSRFDLRWAKVPDVAATSADIDYYAKHHAAGAPKLRRWLLSGDPQRLLNLLARAHLRLIVAGAADPAERVLEAAAQAQDLADFEARLTLVA